MKALYDKLTKQISKYEEIVDRRENIYYDRTYEWQESEKGQDYEEKTELLQEILSQMQELHEKIDEYLNF